MRGRRGTTSRRPGMGGGWVAVLLFILVIGNASRQHDQGVPFKDVEESLAMAAHMQGVHHKYT